MFSPSQEQLASSSSSEFQLFKLYASKVDGITYSFMLPLSSHNKVFTLYMPNKHMLILFANPVQKHRLLELKRIQQLSPSFKILKLMSLGRPCVSSLPACLPLFSNPSHFHTSLVSEAFTAVTVDWHLWGTILQRPLLSCLKWQWITLVTLPGWIWRSYFFILFYLFLFQRSFISICYLLKWLLT